MGKAHEIVIGRVTNPGATITALTAGTANSFTVRAFEPGSKACLNGIWSQQATAGVVRVRSPKMHDSTQGIRVNGPAAVIRNAMHDAAQSPLYSTDVLTFEMSGGGAEVDAAALSIYYENLSGGDARLAMWEQVKAGIANYLTVQVAVTGPATSGDWSAGNALNSLFDLLKADTDYAILGYGVDAEVLAVGIQGPDTGNYRTGGPGPIDPLETRSWFVRRSIDQATPLIPVINSNNRGGTSVSVARITAAGTINVFLSMAELSR